MEKLKIIKYRYELLFILLFVSPVIIFGNNDIEEYMLVFFIKNLLVKLFIFIYCLLRFLWTRNKNAFRSWSLFHPLNIFLFNLKIYYFLFIFIHLIIQIEFTKKLLKHFCINFSNPIF